MSKPTTTVVLSDQDTTSRPTFIRSFVAVFPSLVSQPQSEEVLVNATAKPGCQWIEQDGRLVCRWVFPA